MSVIVCNLFNTAFLISETVERRVNGYVSDELERMWRETVVAYFKLYFGSCLDGLRKITKISVIIACLRAEIWTRDLSNTKQVCQPLYHDVRWHASGT
jgi:hypothetical protein